MSAQVSSKPAQQSFSMVRSIRLAMMMLSSMVIGGSTAMVIYNVFVAPSPF